MTDTQQTQQPTYMVIDLETTGLDPAKHRIVEVAIIVTDKNLNPLGGWETKVSCPKQAEWQAPAKHMHLGNGLAVDNDGIISIAGPVLDPVSVENRLCEIAAAFPERPILAGSSVHFDRGFIHRWWPSFDALLSHRHLDASAIKLLMAGDWGKTDNPHRAMPDAAASLDLLRRMRDACSSAICGS